MPRQTLPKRFKRRADFLRLAAQGRKLVKPGFVLQALRQIADAEAPSIAPAPVLGFTATKKIGNAVIRNRAKRRLREASRLVLAGRNAAGLELVLVARRETGTMPFATLCRNLAQAVDEFTA
ncbi:ribonuclease P protein component [Acidocella sp.]|uniref:ribonuclease P protein component n=1 Tax=Acidocella sp. TaxID=50710 RepID=UPI002605C264|nr:ribonuclease P protein component [Acidocella sp.]